MSQTATDKAAAAATMRTWRSFASSRDRVSLVVMSLVFRRKLAYKVEGEWKKFSSFPSREKLVLAEVLGVQGQLSQTVQ